MTLGRAMRATSYSYRVAYGLHGICADAQGEDAENKQVCESRQSIKRDPRVPVFRGSILKGPRPSKRWHRA
jgi:hypothetical protein